MCIMFFLLTAAQNDKNQTSFSRVMITNVLPRFYEPVYMMNKDEYKHFLPKSWSFSSQVRGSKQAYVAVTLEFSRVTLFTKLD